jgi:hypothetical protein
MDFIVLLFFPKMNKINSAVRDAVLNHPATFFFTITSIAAGSKLELIV